MHLGFPSAMCYFPPQWSQYSIRSWCLNNMVFSPIEISITIPSRSTDRETFVFPVEVCVIFPGEAWRRMLYPCICTDLLLWCDYFQIMFFPSDVKTQNRILFPQLVLTFLWNLHLGCDLSEYWLYPCWFCLVIPGVICLFCQHSYIHTYITHSWI